MPKLLINEYKLIFIHIIILFRNENTITMYVVLHIHHRMKLLKKMILVAWNYYAKS